MLQVWQLRIVADLATLRWESILKSAKSECDVQAGESYKGKEGKIEGAFKSPLPLAIVNFKLVNVSSVGDQKKSDGDEYQKYVDEILFEVEEVIHAHGTFRRRLMDWAQAFMPFAFFFEGLFFGFFVGFKVFG